MRKVENHLLACIDICGCVIFPIPFSPILMFPINVHGVGAAPGDENRPDIYCRLPTAHNFHDKWS
jgi:hypothetical protein